MNISLQNVDNVSAVLTVQIEKADYQEKVEKALKTLRQRVNMPGFRKGMVPMGLIKKQYGTSVLLEEVDKLLQEKVGEYIRENKVNMLGTPLPKENNANFETDENFEFSFDIALAPEFNVELSNNEKQVAKEKLISGFEEQLKQLSNRDERVVQNNEEPKENKVVRRSFL